MERENKMDYKTERENNMIHSNDKTKVVEDWGCGKVINGQYTNKMNWKG